MNCSTSSTLVIDTDHLRDARTRNVHLVRWHNDQDHLESIARKAATTLNHHLALIDCAAIHTEEDVLRVLSDAFLLPQEIRARAISNWNVMGDAVGDLAWLLGPPYSKQGIIAVVRSPESFMRENLLQFAFLIDELGSRSQWRVRAGIAYNVLIGPLPQDARYEIFLNSMIVSAHYCEACQSVDCPNDDYD